MYSGSGHDSLSSKLDSLTVCSKVNDNNLLCHRHSAFCHLHLRLQIFTRRCCTRDTQLGAVFPLPRTNVKPVRSIKLSHSTLVYASWNRSMVMRAWRAQKKKREKILYPRSCARIVRPTKSASTLLTREVTVAISQLAPTFATNKGIG